MSTSYAYVKANRLLTVNHFKGSTSLGRFDYGYSTVNNRTYEKRDGGSGDAYSYDAIDQVTGFNMG